MQFHYCKDYGKDAIGNWNGSRKPDREAGTNSDAESDSGSKSRAEPESDAESRAEPESNAKPRAEPESDAKSDARWKSETNANSDAQSDADSKSHPALGLNPVSRKQQVTEVELNGSAFVTFVFLWHLQFG